MPKARAAEIATPIVVSLSLLAVLIGALVYHRFFYRRHGLEVANFRFGGQRRLARGATPAPASPWQRVTGWLRSPGGRSRSSGGGSSSALYGAIPFDDL